MAATHRQAEIKAAAPGSFQQPERGRLENRVSPRLIPVLLKKFQVFLTELKFYYIVCLFWPLTKVSTEVTTWREM